MPKEPKIDLATHSHVRCPGTCGSCLYITDENTLKCTVPRCTHYDIEWEMPVIELKRVPDPYDEIEDAADRLHEAIEEEPPEPPSPAVKRLRHAEGRGDPYLDGIMKRGEK